MLSRAVPAQAEVEVRSGDAAGGTHATDLLSTSNVLASMDSDLGEMKRHRDQAVAVVDEDCATGEEVLFGEDDATVGGGEDRSAGSGGEGGSGVGGPGRGVEDPARPH